MKVGIDARPLQDKSKFRGIGYYLSHILTEISKIDHTNDYFLYVYSGATINLRFNKGFKHSFIEVGPFTDHELRYKLKASLRQPIDVSSENLDLFLVSDPSYGIPRGVKKAVGVLYDLIPVLFSARYPEGKFKLSSKQDIKRFLVRVFSRYIYNQAYQSILRTQAIICISKSTKSDLLGLFHYPKDQVFVTPLAPDPVYKPVATKEADAIIKKYGLQVPFIMYVGGTDFRKNIEGLIQAFEKVAVKQKDLQLVLVGNDFIKGVDPDSLKIRRRIERSKFEKRIIRPGYVANDDLAALYSLAKVFAYPSIYEGFGLPILEAMACGCPVIAYDNSSIPEVADDAGLLLNETDDLAAAVSRVINDIELRKSLVKKGFEQARKFTWEKTARETLRILESAGAEK